MSTAITIPKRIAQRIREEARKLGISPDEYLVELITQNLDPKDRAVEYIETAIELLGEARLELEKGDLRQAAEKTWGAAALAIKAYAWWREGKRLASHGELWKYIDIVVGDLGGWVYHAWHDAIGMHVCFYEGWCTPNSVKTALEQVERLVKKIHDKVKTSTP